MNKPFPNSYTSFDGYRRIAGGSLQANAVAVKRALESGAAGPLLIFDEATGRSIDVDTRGSEQAVVARLAEITANAHRPESTQPRDSSQSVASSEVDAERRGRGRPKLGVVPREVTLLPRHWEWLATQPGGASVTLRRLVEEARRATSDKDKIRNAHERAYHFMLAIAGNLPDFEEATRALFANDRLRFGELIGTWPGDVGDHATRLAFGDVLPASSLNNYRR
jgi:hypothetical protein